MVVLVAPVVSVAMAVKEAMAAVADIMLFRFPAVAMAAMVVRVVMAAMVATLEPAATVVAFP